MPLTLVLQKTNRAQKTNHAPAFFCFIFFFSSFFVFFFFPPFFFSDERPPQLSKGALFLGKAMVRSATVAGRLEGILVVSDMLTMRGSGHCDGVLRYGQLNVQVSFTFVAKGLSCPHRPWGCDTVSDCYVESPRSFLFLSVVGDVCSCCRCCCCQYCCRCHGPFDLHDDSALSLVLDALARHGKEAVCAVMGQENDYHRRPTGRKIETLPHAARSEKVRSVSAGTQVRGRSPP